MTHQVSQSLLNIPIRKLHSKIESLIQSCEVCSAKIKITNGAAPGACKNCSLMIIAMNRWYSSNIPVEYWDLSIDANFKGPKELIDVYEYIINDFNVLYKDGKSICLAGAHGIGKSSIVANILKKACLKNYSCIYTTLSDIVSILTSAPSIDRFDVRRDLLISDLLVVDEFDPRFVSSDNSADLFGRTLESVLRGRMQNQLPIILCSNSPNPVDTFNGALKDSIGSLMNRVKIIPVLGKDYRKTLGANG